jgi:hypothetical protein
LYKLHNYRIAANLWIKDLLRAACFYHMDSPLLKKSSLSLSKK